MRLEIKSWRGDVLATTEQYDGLTAWVQSGDLSGVDLRDANLRAANLRDANLRAADLSDADLSDANLSGVIGLLDPVEWLKTNFETDAEGVIVYKRIGAGATAYSPPAHWTIEPGAYLTEVVNPTRTLECACGVNFGTRDWCRWHYEMAALWRCRIEWWDLAGVVVPYNTDGKARCGRLRLIEPVI